jgi:hypothetical protein
MARIRQALAAGTFPDLLRAERARHDHVHPDPRDTQAGAKGG